jgi:hypothetical protein
VIAEWLCRGWHLRLRNAAGRGTGAAIAEALCRPWHLRLRNPGRSPPDTIIAEALCRRWLCRPRVGAVTDDTVAFAAELIDRSGRAPVIEAALAHATGRRRGLPVRAVLTALLCLALDDRPLLLTEVTRLLPPSVGFFPPPARRPRRRCCHRARLPGRLPPCPLLLSWDLLGRRPLPAAENRRLTEPDLQAAARQITPAQATAARDRLESLINALLEASIKQEKADFDGSTGLDATPVPLFSRGPAKRAGLAASDPDGGWYIRDGDHREREDHKGRTVKKIAWALEATIATTARPPGAQPARTWPSAWR